MTPPPASILAPCSRPSTPLRAAYRGGLRPVLTAPARGALRRAGRDGETALSRTKKLPNENRKKLSPMYPVQNVTHLSVGQAVPCGTVPSPLAGEGGREAAG